MEELEIKTYDFAVKAIGFAKSIEKELSEIQVNDFKQNSGAVSIKFIEAMNANENEDFANNLRECFEKLQESDKFLQAMETLKIEQLENEKAELISEAGKIKVQLDSIIKKLIY